MEKVDLSTFKKTLNPGAPKLKQILWYYCNIIFFKASWNVFSGVKVRLLRLFGGRVGEGVVIKPAVNIKFPWYLEIGDNTWIGENVWIDNLAQVSIGANCSISQGAMLLTGNHNYKICSFDLITLPIVLDDGVWIGAQAVVCPGVHAASHAILTVASVATKNMDSYTIYTGNPAAAVRKRKMHTIK